jgi:glycosyltransferase involved in cell wall biosynthesis
MKGKPLVSVVTPVYNGERHLGECIESVLAQTYTNWEYIIVNNCSTDGTPDVAKRYASKDERIRLYDNVELVPMGANHDIALGLISPESRYCKVVHADDFLFPECLALMVNVAVENPSVGIVASYRLDDRLVNLDGLPYPSTVVPGREICRQSLLERRDFFGSPSSLLIRSDLMRDRKTKLFGDDTFDLHGDTATCHEILMVSDFGFVHQVLTFTRRHEGATDTPMAQAYNSYLPAHLLRVQKYGPFYLSDAERDECLKGRLDDYYRFLGQSAVKGKKKEFWKFHRHAFNELGIPLSYQRLVRTSVLVAKRAYLFHPWQTLGNMFSAMCDLRRNGSEIKGAG